MRHCATRRPGTSETCCKGCGRQVLDTAPLQPKQPDGERSGRCGLENGSDPEGISGPLEEKRGLAYLEEHPDAVEKTVRAMGREQLATLIYASGTTSRPKGVRLVHDSSCRQHAAGVLPKDLGLHVAEAVTARRQAPTPATRAAASWCASMSNPRG